MIINLGSNKVRTKRFGPTKRIGAAARAIVVVLILAVALAACGASTAKAPASTKTSAHLTFAYMQTDGDQSYFVDEAAGAKAEGAKLGVTVDVENENGSSATTISDEQAAVAAHDNGLVVVAPAASLGPRLVSIANAAHIPIESSDNGFAGSNGKSVPFVGINATAYGKDTGGMLVSHFKKAGWPASQTYAMIYVTRSLPTCQLRTNAETAALTSAGFPASHIINVPMTDNTTHQGLENTPPVITAHPQAKYWLLAGCNTDEPYGGLKAASSHGIPVSHLMGVGLGGGLVCSVWAPGEPNVGLVATDDMNPQKIGATAVKNLYNYVVKHIPMPAVTAITPKPISKATLASDPECKS